MYSFHGVLFWLILHYADYSGNTKDFFFTWIFHFNFASRFIPRYFAWFACGTGILLRVTGCGSIDLLVKLMWVDLDSFTLILHLANQSCILFMAIWSLSVASPIVSPTARIAVSSANVAVVVLFVCGKSLVNSMKRNGPKTLPCGTPALGSFMVE